MNTCEGYVLNRLERLDKEVESLNRELNEVKSKYAELYGSILSLVGRKDYGSDSYLSFNSVWKSSRADTYKFLVDLFHLEGKEDCDNAG